MKPQETWTISVRADWIRSHGDASRDVARWLKCALRAFRLRNVHQGENDGTWAVSFQAVGSALNDPLEARIARLLEVTGNYGLRVVGVRATKADGTPFQMEDFAIREMGQLAYDELVKEIG